MCTSGATLPARKRSSARLLLVVLARRGWGPRVRLLFIHPLEAPAAPVIREEGPENRQPVRLSLPLKVEVLPGSALGAGAGNRT